MKQILIFGTAFILGGFLGFAFVHTYGLLGAVAAAPVCLLLGFGVGWLGNEYL